MVLSKYLVVCLPAVVNHLLALFFSWSSQFPPPPAVVVGTNVFAFVVVAIGSRSEF